ncbi:MAG: hypothetical protein Q7S65_03670 [Nanoarchaeota archaeon]|nr:hypothetical protein [Nanoarchaeota archaeon]
MDYARAWKSQGFNRLNELELARLLAIAATPIQNLLVATLLDPNVQKSVPELAKDFSGFEYRGTDIHEALRKGLARLVELHFAERGREEAVPVMYKLAPMGIRRGQLFAPFHLAAAREFGFWMGEHHGGREVDLGSNSYLRFRAIELLSNGAMTLRDLNERLEV